MPQIVRYDVAAPPWARGAESVFDSTMQRWPSQIDQRIPSWFEPVVEDLLNPPEVGFPVSHRQVRGGRAVLYLPVRLSHKTGQAVTVGFHAREGVQTSYYHCTPGTLHFRPGFLQLQIAVVIQGYPPVGGYT